MSSPGIRASELNNVGLNHALGRLEVIDPPCDDEPDYADVIASMFDHEWHAIATVLDTGFGTGKEPDALAKLAEQYRKAPSAALMVQGWGAFMELVAGGLDAMARAELERA